MLSFFILATSLLSESMVSFDPLCGIAARKETMKLAGPTRYAIKKFGCPQNGESPAHLFFCVSKNFSYFGRIYNPEILVYNVLEIKICKKDENKGKGGGR